MFIEGETGSDQYTIIMRYYILAVAFKEHSENKEENVRRNI